VPEEKCQVNTFSFNKILSYYIWMLINVLYTTDFEEDTVINFAGKMFSVCIKRSLSSCGTRNIIILEKIEIKRIFGFDDE
jgi:hypothetical protein